MAAPYGSPLLNPTHCYITWDRPRGHTMQHSRRQENHPNCLVNGLLFRHHSSPPFLTCLLLLDRVCRHEGIQLNNYKVSPRSSFSKDIHPRFLNFPFHFNPRNCRLRVQGGGGSGSGSLGWHLNRNTRRKLLTIDKDSLRRRRDRSRRR